MIYVKVTLVPGALKDFQLPPGSTVQDAINAAGISIQSGHKVNVNGTQINGPLNQHYLQGQETIMVSSQIKGNR